jgi:hypothetical protein
MRRAEPSCGRTWLRRFVPITFQCVDGQAMVSVASHEHDRKPWSVQAAVFSAVPQAAALA